jgi:RNA recognition motif-containing protein
VIYVAGLNANIDEAAFFEVFRQFGISSAACVWVFLRFANFVGTIMSCIRRAVDFEMSSSGQQYAFIRYSSPQEAKYAIQCGEIEVQGRKMFVLFPEVCVSLLTGSRTIKPRDKKGARSGQRHNSYGSTDFKQSPSYGSKAGDQILRMINKNHKGPANRGNQYFDKQHYDGNAEAGMKVTASRVPSDPHGAPVLMSKSLTVANLPEDMGPKQLYGLFSEVGDVDGVYIFPMCDQAGRRYGHIVMHSFYLAQKVCHGSCRFQSCIYRIANFKKGC